MDLDTLFEDPVRRRGWLLEKALECHSLSEAVALAKSAEEFLSAAEVVDPVGRPHPARDEAAVELTAGGVQGADNSKLSVSGGADTLAVMAVVEDVVQYLRQRGASVLPKDHGTFLVDGQCCKTFEELVERVNRVRREENLPCFVLMPGGSDGGIKVVAQDKMLPAPRGGATKGERESRPRHPPGVREREDWARRVLRFAD